MSIQTEITRIESAKTALATAIEGKGVTVPEGTKLDGMAALIEAISAGGGDYVIGSVTPASDYGTLVIGTIKDTTAIDYPLEFGLAICAEAADLKTTYGALLFANQYNKDGNSGRAICYGGNQQVSVEFGSYGIYASRGKVYIGKYSGTDLKAILSGKTYLYAYKE